jgi:Fe-S-cluster containining protein
MRKTCISGSRYSQDMDALRIRGLTVVCADELKCRGCGTCCSVYETLNLNVSDIFNISSYLGISPEDFFKQYCIQIEDGKGGSTFALDVKGGCRFRKDGKCSIYPVRTDTCALHPFDFPGMNLSRLMKAEVAAEEYDRCFLRDLPDDLIIVPDLERMVSSLILAMVKEMYLARSGDFDGQAALASHNSGMSQVKNPRMREIMHRKLLNEMIRNAPVDPATKETALTAEEITRIYNYVWERVKAKNPDV